MKKIDFKMFKYMLVQGCNNLKLFVPKINKLNVFPVPDGDTGTNMYQTANSGFKILDDNHNNSLKKMVRSFSKASLMGACGNSGVIFSQFFKGFAEAIREEKYISIPNFIEMFKSAKKYAYQAVRNATEGTILTLIRVLAEKLEEDKNSFQSYGDFFGYIQKLKEKVVKNTPNQLEILKEAGVVDSGAFGLGIFLDGMVAGYNGINIKKTQKNPEFEVNSDIHTFQHKEFGYCTEFVTILQNQFIDKLNRDKLNGELNKIGQSTVVVIDEEILKVHVHTLTPGRALTVGERYGSFSKVKIENMTNQVHENKEVILDKENIIIAVADCPSVKKKLKELQVDYVIDGGQSKNPSASSFINIINESAAKNIILMPNNKNILLTTKQVEKHFSSKRNIFVIETRSMWEGINCMMNFSPDWKHIERINNFKKVIKNSVTFKITQAIRDFKTKKITIDKGDHIVVNNDEVIFGDKNIQNLFDKIANLLEKKKMEFIYIIKGKNALQFNELILELEKYDFEIETLESGQEIYSYVIGGE